MAFHNSTPARVLEAPQVTKVILDGTEFTGRNRAQRRKVRGPSPWSYSRVLRRKLTERQRQ